MQALYQWQMTGQPPSEIELQFQEDENFSKADRDYFATLLREVPANTDDINACISRHAGRTMDEIDPVERAILRIACYELQKCIDVPFKVVINEAIELSKKFGAEQGHKFVNSVLDSAVMELRTETSRQ